MKFMVTGACGQLGRVTVEELEKRGIAVLGTDVPAVAQGPTLPLSVDDPAGLEAFFAEHAPTHVLHCGAYTNVDGCETDRDLALRVNGEGTGNVAAACASHGAALLYISTDFVFDGESTRPYLPDDPPGPVSVYGESKLAGETALLAHGKPDFYVLRTAWVFGPGGQNFPKAILKRAREGHPLTVVDDQVGCPTMTRDLAEAMVDLILSGAAGGIYHAVNEGTCSWHGFAVAIVEAAGLDLEVATMSSAELQRPARRPAYSVLDCDRLTQVRGRPLPSYQDALKRYLEEEHS